MKNTFNGSRFSKMLLTVIIAASVSACASGTMVKDPGQYRTESEVINTYGKPQSTMMSSTGTKIITYAMFSFGKSSATSFTIENGVVKSYTHMDM